MAKGLKPNMAGTYGIMIETDMSDHTIPYKVQVYDDKTDKIVASYGATDIHDLLAILTSEVRYHIQNL